MMSYLSQRNPVWAGVHLGSSPLTIGRYGCTTTCISMLSSLFNCYRSPLEIASNAHNYTPDGLILWQNLQFYGMKFVMRLYGRNDQKIMEALRDPGMAIILEVNNKSHWVVAIKKTLIGNDYVVLDPWTGKKCNVLSVYHNITGAAIFARA